MKIDFFGFVWCNHTNKITWQLSKSTWCQDCHEQLIKAEVG